MYLIGSSSSQLILSLGEPSFYPWIWLQTLTSISTLSPSLETDLTLNVPLNYREMQHLFISLNHLHFSQLLVVVPQIVFLNPSLSPIISLHTSVRVILIQYVYEITALPSQTFSSLWSLSLYTSASSKLFDNLSSFCCRHFPPCFPTRALTSRSWSA